MVEEQVTINIPNDEDKPVKKKLGRPPKPKVPKEPKEPKPKKTDDPEYYKNYYKNKMVTCLMCPKCEKILTSNYSLKKHVNNGKCLKYNIKKMYAMMDNTMDKIQKDLILDDDDDDDDQPDNK